MYDLRVIKQNGGAYIDSREVADAIGKTHCHLLRDIRGYCDIIENGGLSKIGLSDFFVESSYLNAQNKVMPCFLLTKMACELVANKLTGEKGVLFTVAYVTKFNEMESAERAELEARAAKPAPRLGEYNACARIVVRVMQNMGAAPGRIIGFLDGLYEPLGITVSDGEDEGFEDEDDEFAGYGSRTYTAKQIAEMHGIYSLSGNPHHQAVACILNENLYLDDRHKTVQTVDYGTHIGVSVLYDGYAAQAVEDWIIGHGRPGEIRGFGRTYRVLYDYQLNYN